MIVVIVCSEVLFVLKVLLAAVHSDETTTNLARGVWAGVGGRSLSVSFIIWPYVWCLHRAFCGTAPDPSISGLCARCSGREWTLQHSGLNESLTTQQLSFHFSLSELLRRRSRKFFPSVADEGP